MSKGLLSHKSYPTKVRATLCRSHQIGLCVTLVRWAEIVNAFWILYICDGWNIGCFSLDFRSGFAFTERWLQSWMLVQILGSLICGVWCLELRFVGLLDVWNFGLLESSTCSSKMYYTKSSQHPQSQSIKHTKSNLTQVQIMRNHAHDMREQRPHVINHDQCIMSFCYIRALYIGRYIEGPIQRGLTHRAPMSRGGSIYRALYGGPYK